MKKIYQTLLITSSILMLLTSCGVIAALVETDEDIMETYKGSNKRELILNWGPPKQTLDDGDYGTILLYYEKEKFEGYYTSGGGGPVGGRTYWKYYFFFADTNNIIYHTLYNEEDIPPTEMELNLYLH
jgi:hypothetical protein